MMMIIGLTGSFCGGKDTVAEYLIEKGFKHISLSNMIREECSKRKIKLTRENLQKIGKELREQNGDSILAERALKKAKGNTIITSIRHPEEVNILKRADDFYLVKVDAPAKVRFERMQLRKREEDPETFGDFLEAEGKEMKGIGSGQRVDECNKMAKIILINDSDLDALNKKIDRLIDDLGGKEEEEYVRPSWDEYFIEIMKQVGKRATCGRGRSGCVIVKDKRILVTGYVGSPPGIDHCDEIGHEFKKVLHEDGQVSNHCVRTTHAEQNAICQAAKLGVSLERATLYCNMTPCYVCAKLIITCGIKKVVAFKDYHASKESKRIFKQAKLELEIINKEVEKYKNM